MAVRKPSPPLPFLAVYVAIILVGSLYPFSGWRGTETWSADFLFDSPPRYITRNDVTTNLLIYLPLGYLLAARLFRPGRRALPILMAWLFGTTLSVGLEGIQVLLPGRIASNLDVFLNSLGALIGALLALHHGRWTRAWRVLRRWRMDWFQPHGHATPGLWLLLAWAFAQFALVPLPGAGWLELHLRPLELSPGHLQQINAPWFFAVLVEMSMLGLFTACLLRPGRYAGAILLFFLATFALKLLAAAILLRPRVVGGALSLETLAAFAVAFWLLLLPSVSRHRMTIAMVLLTLVIAVRLWLAPSPLRPPDSLLNLVGLARWTAAFWPWAALVYLAWKGIRERRG